MLHVCVMHISMMRQFCHGRTDGRTNGDPDTRVYDACIHDAAYLCDGYIHYACMHFAYTYAGLHKLCYPTIRDRSTWSKFGAHGEHGDVFLFSNLGAL